MKQKIKIPEMEIEVETEKEVEFVRYGVPKQDELYSNGRCVLRNTYLFQYPAFILRPIEPPLELETDLFEGKDGSFNKSVTRIEEMEGLISIFKTYFNGPQARDLVKILNYYAEHGKLPERVVVKSVNNNEGE